MLTLFGHSARYCDGVTRRHFLSVGSLPFAGLSFADLLRAEVSQPATASPKSVILIYLAGGISHQDTVDLKPTSPSEVRGEFKPIRTNVVGIELCELLPKLAQVTDKLAILRSLVGQRDEHASHQNLTGYGHGVATRDKRPHAGAIIDKVLGPADPLVPTAVDLFPTMQHRPYNSSDAGVLGSQFNPTRAKAKELELLCLDKDQMSCLIDRKRLLNSLEVMRRNLDDGRFHDLDAAQQQAFEVLTSGQVAKAINVELENPKVLESYGRGSPKHLGDGAPMWNDQLVMARRLVEAGVRLVTVAYGFWDTHGNNFGALRERLPLFDQGISALVEDIYQRGLDKDVMIVVWGEFGRTPKINENAGRDHWARVNSAILSGGGLQTGQVIGATDKLAGEALDRPIDYRDVLTTVYHQLGVDANRMVRDRFGRPIRILPGERKPIAELI